MALLIDIAYEAIIPLEKFDIDFSSKQRSFTLTNNQVYSISDWVYHKQGSPYTISFLNGTFESSSYSHEKVRLDDGESSSNSVS